MYLSYVGRYVALIIENKKHVMSLLTIGVNLYLLL
jgi:hypothetical protein